MQLIWVIIITCKPKVIFIIKPNFKLRLPICDAYPLPDVEFFLLDDHGGLDIFLGDPDFVHAAPYVVYQIIFLTVDLDAAAPRFSAWFNNPCIFGPVQPELERPNRVL